MMKIKRQNKLRTYLAVTAGVGCAATTAEGVVTFFGIESANDTNSNPNDLLFRFSTDFEGNDEATITLRYMSGVYFAQDDINDIFFSQGADFDTSAPLLSRGVSFRYFATGYYSSGLVNGAVAGDQNYANISFDGDDDVYEAVAQFNFDGMGGGFLVAIATINDQPNPLDLSGVGGPALSISEGRDLIEAAAVPEPSSLVLLALGATGLAARRKRKMAA